MAHVLDAIATPSVPPAPPSLETTRPEPSSRFGMHVKGKRTTTKKDVADNLIAQGVGLASTTRRNCALCHAGYDAHVNEHSTSLSCDGPLVCESCAVTAQQILHGDPPEAELEEAGRPAQAEIEDIDDEDTLNQLALSTTHSATATAATVTRHLPAEGQAAGPGRPDGC